MSGNVQHRNAGQRVSPRLVAPLAHQIETAVRAYGSGPLGFEIDVDELRFPADPAKLRLLDSAIRAGVVTGVVVEAFPDISVLWERRRSTEEDYRYDRILEMPRWRFLLEQFVRRGGRLSPPVDESVWSDVREPPTGLSFKSLLDARRREIEAEGRPRQNLSFEKEFQITSRDLSLPLDLSEPVGGPSLFFTDVRPRIPSDSLIFAEGLGFIPRPDEVSFATLAEQGVSMLSPSEFIALLVSHVDPTRPKTYPAQESSEWLSGVVERKVPTILSTQLGLRMLALRPSDVRRGWRVRPSFR